MKKAQRIMKTLGDKNGKIALELFEMVTWHGERDNVINHICTWGIERQPHAFKREMYLGWASGC